MSYPRNTLKFSDEQGGPEHGGLLHWPGTPNGNFPFRGEEVPNLKGREAEDIPLVLDYHSQMFRMWEPAEKLAFDKVMDRIVNGWFMQHKRFDNWISDQQHYVIWLEWVQIYGEVPGVKHPGGQSDNQPYVVGSQNRGRASFMQSTGVRSPDMPRPVVLPGGFRPLQNGGGEHLL